MVPLMAGTVDLYRLAGRFGSPFVRTRGLRSRAGREGAPERTTVSAGP